MNALNLVHLLVLFRKIITVVLTFLLYLIKWFSFTK